MVKPELLDTNTFLDVVEGTLYSVVRVGRGGRIAFHRGVAEYFERKYPRLFSFGTLNKDRVYDQRWWGHNFRSTFGALRTAGQEGYFLFETGNVVGHHTGHIADASLGFTDTLDNADELERIRTEAFGGSPSIPQHALEAARQIIVELDEVVARKQREAGFAGDFVRDSGAGGWAPPPSTPTPSRNASSELDPYELLEVSPDADDAAVRAAFKRAMKLNHPDKVAHMSQAIQDFAQSQVVAIKAAYESIRRMRS